MKCFIITVLCFLPLIAVNDIPAQSLYWIDGVAGKIQSCGETASGINEIVTGTGTAYAIATDVKNNKIYWTDNTSKTIKSSDIDGKNIQTLVTQTAGSIVIPRGIALNINDGKIYWTDNGSCKLMSANLDGSSVQTLVSGLDSPGFISYDSQNSKIYWADNGLSAKKIQRCSKDASSVEDVATGVKQVWGIALDIPDSLIYWTDSETHAIMKGSLSSLPVTPAVVLDSLAGSPRGLVIDKMKNYLFWTTTAGAVMRANLDGSLAVPVAQNLNYPQGIAIDCNSALPVELVSFSAQVTKGHVSLVWSTATETNNSKFEVERLDFPVWKKIGEVAGSGTSTQMKDYQFTDMNLKSGTIFYRLMQVDYDGSFRYSDKIEVTCNSVKPGKFDLLANYPNPFNPSTTISYQLSETSDVELKIFDIMGREVSELVKGKQEAGSYNARFEASSVGGGLASGIYIARFKAGSFCKSIKMNLLK
jgi:sugar lactone lactonase YvrE